MQPNNICTHTHTQLYYKSDLLVEYPVSCISIVKVSPLKTHTTHCQMTRLDIQPSQHHHKHSNGVQNDWKIKSHVDLIPISTMEYERLLNNDDYVDKK